MRLLEARSLSAGYGKASVIEDIDIALDRGELIAIVGPNGSGKSTLLKAIMGLATVFGGEVEFQGEVITSLDTEQKVKKGIGYVPQVSNIFMKLTVEENLELGGYYLDGPATKEAMEEVFRIFPLLRERRQQRAESLSGGERQMLAIGRALMTRPTILLLDEPAAGFSPKLASQLFHTIKAISSEGTGVILVEQHVRRALEASHRAYVMASGRKVLEGLSEELLTSKQLEMAFLGAT